ncbi:uncharacterized protein LOC115887094 [Sitophilus oryzae]|uniref:Uncharacterized protein LOC115887094 n=1 Tax=Sitophilus oryzae TaxID=7048 RepID=A0A6J2YGP2_SITOR|nr:uncharacterized protein LOC115887094 [Sitophilus oryzae]
MRIKYLKNANFFIEPQPFYIGSILDNKKSGSTVNMTFKKCEGQIIPLRKILKHFLEIPGVLNTILEYQKSEENKDHLSSIFNGELWKSIKIKYNKIVIPLLIYYDDFETGNPLGSHSGIYKLGGVYVKIAGIPPKYSSKLENIFLWGLFYSQDRNEFSNRKVFQSFLNELLYLENVGLNIFGQQILFVAPLIVGDNLGINSVIGFQESFSANYFCRACFLDKKSTQAIIVEGEDTLRNVKNYQEHLENKTFGIKDECIWNDLPYYHNAINIHFDIMHDLFEGVCRYDMGRILHFFILDQKTFTLEILNNRIKYFNYISGTDIGNAIPPINLKHIQNKMIIMSSAEMHALVTYLPLIVGDLVDSSERVWKFYIILFELIHMATQSEFNKDDICFLKQLIFNHNKMYKELFNDPLTPKMHFLIHYPRTIINVGPLEKLSSIRFEAFHRIFKISASTVTCKINLPYTLATKCQFNLAYRFLSKKGFNDEIIVGSVLKTFSSLNLLHYKNYSNSNVVSWVKINGITFKKEFVIQVGRNNYGEPIFGWITDVLYENDNKIYMVYQEIICFGLNKHFKGFEIDRIETEKKLINVNDIFFKPTIIHNNAKGNRFISCMI